MREAISVYPKNFNMIRQIIGLKMFMRHIRELIIGSGTWRQRALQNL